MSEFTTAGVGEVTNPTAQEDLPPKFNPGDVVWQANHAPDGYRYEVVTDNGATVVAKPVAQYIRADEDDPGHLEPCDGDPVELNGRHLTIAED